MFTSCIQGLGKISSSYAETDEALIPQHVHDERYKMMSRHYRQFSIKRSNF